MFAKVLDCPECGHRFSYEHEGETFPETIGCPECKCVRNYKEFASLLFCRNCRAKLKIPLDILFDPKLSCPECGTSLKVDTVYSDDTAISTFTAGDKDLNRVYKRMLQDGDIFDKYQIIRLLGKGGMAEVYLAEHLLLKQKCAVKLMQNAIGSDDQVYAKRFLREAKLSHKFDHPNMVKVFDVGSDFQTGYLFIAMEYVDGKTLNELLKERPFTEKELFDILKAMTNALNAMVEARVVHRDIKPSNIMQDKDGVYKLMDLGIAKSENGSQNTEAMLTLDQSSIGTPNYASPEQCRSAHHVDFRSDIYRLGATLYHLASGRLPFRGDTPMETVLNVLQTEATPLKEYRSDLSDKFINIVEMMMKKNPLERPQTPDALMAEIFRSGSDSKPESFFRKYLKKLFAGNSAKDAVYDDRAWYKKLIFPRGLTVFQRIFRIVKLLIAIAVISLIAFNIKYLSNISKGVKSAEKVSGLNSVDAKKLAGRLTDDLHPMVRYPDTAGDLNTIKRFSNRKFQTFYPVVEVVSPDPEALKVCFDSRLPEDKRKGVISGKTAGTEYLEFPETSYTLAYKSDIRRHIGLSFAEFTAGEFTLSLDLYLPDSGWQPQKGYILRAGDIQLFYNTTRSSRLLGVIVGSSYVYSNLQLPLDCWVNISLVLSNNGQRLALYSGNRLAGVWILPRKKGGYKFKLIDFFTFPAKLDRDKDAENIPLAEWDRAMFKFTGRISRLYLWNKAAAVTLMPQSAGSERNDYQILQTASEAQQLPDNWFVVPKAVPAPVPAPAAEKSAVPESAASAPEPAAEKSAEAAGGNLQETNKEDNSKTALEVSADKAVTEKTASTGEDVSSETPGSLNGRLKSCQDELAKLQSDDTADNKAAREEYLQKKIKALEEQIEYRRNIFAASGKYSDDPAPELIRMLTGFNGWYNTLRPVQRERMEDDIYKYISNSTTNPDFKFNGELFPIYLADKCDDFSRLADFRALLKNKYSDGNAVLQALEKNYKNFTFKYWQKGFVQQWYKQGVEDVDKEKVFNYLGSRSQAIPPVIGFAESCIKMRKYALKLVDFDDLKKFLLLHPEINRKTNKQGKNLMHFAAECDDTELAQILLNSNFTGSKDTDNNGITPWRAALRSGSSGMVKFLKENNLTTREEANDSVQLKFWQSLYRLDANGIIAALRKNANPYLACKYGLNALQYACMRGRDDIVKLLIEKNVQTDIYFESFEFDNHPLLIAIRKQHYNVFKQLLASRVTLTGREKSQFNMPGHFHDAYGNGAVGLYLVVIALRDQWSFSKFKMFFDLLDMSPGDINNKRISGYNILSLACLSGNTTGSIARNDLRRQIASHLLQCGADFNQVHVDLKATARDNPSGSIQNELRQIKEVQVSAMKKNKNTVSDIQPTSRVVVRPVEYTSNFQQPDEEVIYIKAVLKRSLRIKLHNGELHCVNGEPDGSCFVRTRNIAGNWRMRNPFDLRFAGDVSKYYIYNVSVNSSNRNPIYVSNAEGRSTVKTGAVDARVIYNKKEIEITDSKNGDAVVELRIVLSNDPSRRYFIRSYRTGSFRGKR